MKTLDELRKALEQYRNGHRELPSYSELEQLTREDQSSNRSTSERN